MVSTLSRYKTKTQRNFRGCQPIRPSIKTPETPPDVCLLDACASGLDVQKNRMTLRLVQPCNLTQMSNMPIAIL